MATEDDAQMALARAEGNAVDTAFGYSGASTIYADHPLQRCFRDLHAAAQHIYFSPAASKRYARTRRGIEQPTFMFSVRIRPTAVSGRH